MNDTTVSKSQEAPWIFFIPQLPPKPDYLRVKLRRRLQKIGAMSLRNAVYVLPSNETSMEDFMWLRAEIKADGGDAIICVGSPVAGITDNEIQTLFDTPNRPMTGRTWVTRTGVFVDRIACAWMIRRFIDPSPTFKFVAQSGYRPEPGDLRFDMFDGEYTHEGDNCTFEVLLQKFALTDPALSAIAEIVHDIDLKDSKFNSPETIGVETILSGIANGESDDNARIAKATPLFDGLYARFSTKP